MINDPYHTLEITEMLELPLFVLMSNINKYCPLLFCGRKPCVALDYDNNKDKAWILYVNGVSTLSQALSILGGERLAREKYNAKKHIDNNLDQLIYRCLGMRMDKEEPSWDKTFKFYYKDVIIEIKNGRVFNCFKRKKIEEEGENK